MPSLDPRRLADIFVVSGKDFEARANCEPLEEARAI
jgi:hypothetical protein